MWAVPGIGAASTPIPGTAQARPPAYRSAATATPDSVTQQACRLRLLVGGSALSYGVIYTGLTTAQYTNERVPLH